MATITVSSLRKSFGRVEAVKDVSFEVFPGEVFGMLGPNGAGKTTAIRVMMDIYQPDGGELTILGGKLSLALKQRIGYLPEERGLYKDLTVEKTLIFLATLKGLSEKEARSRLDPWLERMDLYTHRKKKVEELSKGMQQKAQIIATLLHEPDLLVLDEPFSGLDPINTRLVKDIIEEQRQAGKTIIMSTHQMYQVEALCNRIVLIDHGRSVLYGEVDEIKHRFASNAILVKGEGDFTSLPGASDLTRQNGDWRITLKPGFSPAEAFHSLANLPSVRVERFEVAEPSLDDIFISVVQGSASAGSSSEAGEAAHA
ncbi:MAG TPA: ATP-binding cassette domain-containing protein [Anaerolineales bacterium]